MEDLFERACSVDPDDALRRALEAESLEEKSFFTFLASMNLRIRKADLMESAVLEPEYRPEIPAELTPSDHGKECLGNGEWPGYECCCDECDHYLTCWGDVEPDRI